MMNSTKRPTFLLKKIILALMAVAAGAVSAEIVDCAEESMFAVIGSSGEEGLGTTAKSLGEAIARREGWTDAPPVETIVLPPGAASRTALLDYCAKVRSDHRVKRVGALVTPSVYAFTTNLMLYTCRTWPEAAKFPMGWNKHADMLEFKAGDPITGETLDFICGYRIDWDDPVCSFESGEPPLIAAAGVFEVQRTGNDTSGKNWAWTRNNGVNTLAMRSIQDGELRGQSSLIQLY